MAEIINRFKEPSSYAALCGVLAMVGMMVPAQYQTVMMLGCAVAGAVGFFASEKKD